MKTFETIAAYQQWRTSQPGKRIAFVPTMGNLHQGHLSLIEIAKQHADRVVVSIFVNPLQFAPHEDYHDYPRTLLVDCEKLQYAGVDAVFLPADDELLPAAHEQQTYVEVPHLSSVLCGASRKNYMRGIATIVLKLFNIVRPDCAVFGEKDLQQLRVIEKMVADLHLDIKIFGAPIVREEDGLAMSSRNRYLTHEQRQLAPYLYQTLQKIKTNALTKKTKLSSLIDTGCADLIKKGFKMDYLTVRDYVTLSHPQNDDVNGVLFAAGYLGKTRLIDNLMINRHD